ncbi:MAG: glycoside hydrolase family 6 protein [Actinobacteria bacterium]|nr:glycoside hydrolase family 6 protein [Actinomycetota bacterium]
MPRIDHERGYCVRRSLLVALLVCAVAVPSVGAQATTHSNPFAGATFFVDPASNAAREVASDPAKAAIWNRLAHHGQADWFGDWFSTDAVAGAVADRVATIRSAGALPLFVVYAVPQRDCGGYSSGGTNTPEDYRRWVDRFASGLGAAKAAVVLEPDALAMLDCLNSADAHTRLDLLSWAVDRLNAQGNVSVYLDAGHSRWKPASTMAQRLVQAGVARARGFSLNVSNFHVSADEIAYGTTISDAIGGKTFVVDTSRNGLGPSTDPNEPWCNPLGRALGTPPTAATGNGHVDAFLWIKRPGESDGTCKGGPPAGQWWKDYAFGLAERAPWVTDGSTTDDGSVPGTQVVRLWGKDRTETAAIISAATFPPGVPVAYLATGEGFADALAGGPAAARAGAPILLTGRDSLPQATADELARLRPAAVTILGGTAVVSETVRAQAADVTGASVDRLGGTDRYATAAGIARRSFASGVDVAYVATGRAFADALTGGVPAAIEGGPILLTEPQALPASTVEALRALRPARIVILGGTAAVSEAVHAQLTAYAPVSRRWGTDRFATAAAVLGSSFPGPVDTVFLATGERYPDALAGVPAAFSAGAPLAIVESRAIPQAVGEQLQRLSPRRIVLLGGTTAIDAGVETAARSYLR